MSSTSCSPQEHLAYNPNNRRTLIPTPTMTPPYRIPNSRPTPKHCSITTQPCILIGAGYKPDAISHNIGSEDIDHFLKHGSFLYGEAFHRGVRLPRKGGHADPLPDSFTENSQPAVPLLPELTDVLEVCCPR